MLGEGIGVWGGQRSIVVIVCCQALATFFESSGPLTDLEFANETSLAGQQAPVVCVSASPALGLQGHTPAFSFWELKLGSPAFKANALLTEMSLVCHILGIKNICCLISFVTFIFMSEGYIKGPGYIKGEEMGNPRNHRPFEQSNKAQWGRTEITTHKWIYEKTSGLIPWPLAFSP